VLILDESRAPLLKERWERALRLGVRADGDAYPLGASGSDLAVRRDRLSDVFREERALIEPITEQLAARGLVALVADPDGVIVSAHGGGAFLSPAARVRLVEGACWSEQARGTNAIGTAIVEKRSVAVVGAAHFEERNRSLFCYATPIHDGYGELVAVLDVTGDMALHDPAVGVAVQAAGTAVERALRNVAFARAGAGVLAAIERLVHRARTPTLLVEATGGVRIANAAALQAFPVGGELTCARLFGLSFAELDQLARSPGSRDRSVRFETRAVAYRVELEPLAGPGGRTLAVLVHLDAERDGRVFAAAHRPAATPMHAAFDAIRARDEGVARAKGAAARFAGTSLPVLLLAETGTGKELFAHAIHGASARARGPFVPLNCGALAPSLLESELFGYAPGAFTGAARAGSEGRLGAAHGGTLFLDEIAEMPEALQAALLRVLDDGVYQRLGESKARRADFRLVCATCRDLPALVEAGAFRRDLFYRIHGALVTIPPLRERSDRVWLAEELLAREAPDAPPLAEDARAWIAEHDWPGNVRELKSAITHALALAEGREITRDDFPRFLLGRARAGASASAKTRDELMRDAVRDAVRACNGNLSEAARRLGIARSTVYRAMR
jgi:sigma-54 dependent transcriptional regulator, acetoin dehydrogenase operon transcriptional activator AcoR